MRSDGLCGSFGASPFASWLCRGKFQALVQQHWEGKFHLVNADGSTAIPKFAINYVDDMMDAHFVLNLRAGDGGSELVARDVYYKVKNPEGFAPTSAKLFTGSVEATDSSGDLIKDLQNSFPYYIDTPGGGMSSHATEQLRLVAMQLQRADPTASLEVTAYGSNKSTVRASVIAKLQTFGIANASKRTSKKVFGSKNPNTNSKDYVKIGLASGMGMVDTSSLPLFSYPAAAAQSESSSPSIATFAADGVSVLPARC